MEEEKIVQKYNFKESKSNKNLIEKEEESNKVLTEGFNNYFF